MEQLIPPMAIPKEPCTPLPPPLSGSVYGSFAHYTITQRFPRVIRDVIKGNMYPPEVTDKLQTLLAEIPGGKIRLLNDPAAPDSEIWKEYLYPNLDKNWLQVSWYDAESYFYRRILEAIGYFQPGPLKGLDPYASQKNIVLEDAFPAILLYCKELEAIITNGTLSPSQQAEHLERLMVMNVWGNQADLSMWSAESTRPNHKDTDTQYSHLLVNDSDSVKGVLFNPEHAPNRVDFILDNYGPELVHDFGLADFLLSLGIVKEVRFNVRSHPTYVSDAVIADIHYLIDFLAHYEDQSASSLASRLNQHIANGKLQIQDDYFWTSPRYFWEIPKELYLELSNSDLLISKGDYNYRRLVGDYYWPHTTRFEQVVCYLPTPLVALRVLKAELALGLTPQQVERLQAEETDWLFNGNWAVIQFARKASSIDL
jgi:Damage-control phosphatase ARMT1-like domain